MRRIGSWERTFPKGAGAKGIISMASALAAVLLVSAATDTTVAAATGTGTATGTATALAATVAPVPSGAHPRLFMSAANLARFTSNADTPGTAAAEQVRQCQATIDKPGDFAVRGGADGNYWPNAALACSFAYLTTHEGKYLTQALLYWRTSLNDDQNRGDNLGCTAASSATDWIRWNDNPPAPPVILTITHDTGYPIRWYGPYLALTYDWLYSAPGVDEGLRRQTRDCLTRWLDYYSERGYLHDEAGFNYNAGFVVAKTLGAVAIGNDGGADGHLWSQTVSDIFANLLVKNGLKGSTDSAAISAAAGAPAALDTPATAIDTPATAGPAVGVMVGGDWGSWQYGPLSVAEYAVATRALEEHGVPQPEMDAWVSSLIVRHIHGTTPNLSEQFFGNGDFDSETVYSEQDVLQTSAVLLGPSTSEAAGWALFERRRQNLGGGTYFWDALAEIRDVPAKDYRAQTPPPPLWYVARGSGTLYARTNFGPTAYWGVFMSSPSNADHQHFAASNFVFSRGGDHLIVDSSNYGEPATFETNAVSADSPTSVDDYAFTQGPWSEAHLPWARSAGGPVFAARSDFAKAFIFNDNPSPIPYAHREWVMLPEGEIVTIDRVQTGAADRNMYVNFHANTHGTLKLTGGTKVATGSSGASTLTIHPILLSGGTPRIVKPPVGACKLSCSSPCGSCAAARFAVDEYSVVVPGPWAVAIHVIDGLGAGEAAAQTGSLNDDTLDPAPKQNAGIIGAAVYRGGKHSYVIAASASSGVAADSGMTYATPGGAAALHVVYDAPEASDGTSTVATSVQGARCVVTIGAGMGGGFAGHPLVFQVATSGDKCAVSDDINVAAGTPGGPPGSGAAPVNGATPGKMSGRPGCGCATGGSHGASLALLLAFACVVRLRPRQRRGDKVDR